jgi:hypothetical protein
MVASEAFRPAARAQAEAIGFEPAIVWVPHPIQNRSPEELREIAAAAIDEILQQLTPG